MAPCNLVGYTKYMKIVWNKVTWYSKLVAILFFIFIVPIIVFYIGKEYGQTQEMVNQYQSSVITPSDSIIMPIPKNVQLQATTTPVINNLTGVSGIATLGPTCPVQVAGQTCPDSPYIGTLIVSGNNGKTITTTRTRPDGKFVLFLDAGTYTITLPTSTEPFPRMSPVKISIVKGKITDITLNIDNGIR